MSIKAFATDLDGTLIPLDDHPQNRTDLQTVASILNEHDLGLLFVTGRHFESVAQGMQQYGLPIPDWIICDVGTTIMQRHKDGSFEVATAYAEHLSDLVTDCPGQQVIAMLADEPSVRRQEAEKLGPFKVSYYTEASRLQQTAEQLFERLSIHNAPWSIISSIDPFNGDGLIDLLPVGVSKSYAINWWAAEQNLNAEQVVFSGDSGNDIAALTAGFKAIVVGNASPEVIQRTRDSHRDAGWTDRLFISKQCATSGVVDGLQHYLK